jgi:hypothetical protein
MVSRCCSCLVPGTKLSGCWSFLLVMGGSCAVAVAVTFIPDSSCSLIRFLYSIS